MFKFLSTVLFLLTSVTAIDLTRRECTYLSPTSLDILDANNPSTPSLGTNFALSLNTKTTALTFTNIPTTATGCILQLALPPLTQDQQIASGPATQAEIWKTAPWSSSNGNGDEPTWDQPPRKDQMVGTTGFPTQKTDVKDVRWLASDTCKETMSFLVELSGWQTGEGEVYFENRVDGGEADLGFRLVYGC